MTPTSADFTTSPKVLEVAANASLADREHFQALWRYTINLREQGIIGYFLPRTMAIQMGYQELKDIAKRLSGYVKTNIYIVFDDLESAYYIGQVFHEDYLRNVFDTTSVHLVQFQEPQQLPPHQNHNQNPASPSGAVASVPSTPDMAGKIPKPRNMWIIYRQEKHNFVLEMNPGMHTSQISSIISNKWQNELAEVKEHYKKLAEEEKSNHRLQYPDYKCSPRKSSEIKKRKRSSEEYYTDGHQPSPPQRVRVS